MGMEGGSRGRVSCNEMVIYVDDCRSSYTGFKKHKHLRACRAIRVSLAYPNNILSDVPRVSSVYRNTGTNYVVSVRTMSMETRHVRFSRETPVPIGCIHLFRMSSTANSRLPPLPLKANPPICAGEVVICRSYIRLYVWDYMCFSVFPCTEIRREI